MTNSVPHVIVLGGPNGAGKSTAASILLRDELAVTEFLNADVIAEEVREADPGNAAIAAGRIMLERISELTQRRLDFAFESTLASRSLARFLREARDQGFRTHIVFLWLDGPDLAVARVHQRVASGGHLVPEGTVRRRYSRGIANFFGIYRALADRWRFYDNSWPPAPRLIARGGAGLEDEILDGTTWTRARSSE